MILKDVLTGLHIAGFIGCAVLCHILWDFRNYSMVRPFWVKNLWYVALFFFLLIGDFFNLWPFNHDSTRRVLFNFVVVGATYHVIFSLLTRRR